MSKFLARLMTVVMFINAVISMSFNTVFADEGSGFSFEWDKNEVLNDSLTLENRGSKYDNALFWWDFGVNDGLNFDGGKYKLSYNIADNKSVDFTVEKKAAAATVTYNVYDHTKGENIGIDDTVYQVYRTTTGNYVAPTSETIPVGDESFRVNYDDKTGKPTEVSFNIIQNTGFSFKFDNRNIKFKWVSSAGGNDLFYFVTDGLRTGNIYDVSLDLTLSGNTVPDTSKKLEIFTGINTDTFVSAPYANARKGDAANPIDHTIKPRPTQDENPGFEPELVLSFDMPKVWDKATHKYAYPDTKTLGEDKDKTSVIMDLSNDSDRKKIQINIDNIYADDINSVTTIANASGANAEAYVEVDQNRVYVNITNLQSGTIYNPVEISLYKPNNMNFLSDSSNLPLGTVYTYPEFSVISSSVDEFYIKIEPYVGYSGFYTVKQGLTSQTMSQWVEYEDKTGGAASIYLPIDSNAINNKTIFLSVEFEVTPPDNTPGQKTIKTTSQILKYTPDESDVIIGTPKNLEVTDLFIVKEPTTEKKEMLLSLKWDVAYKTILENLIKRTKVNKLDVNYIFNKGDIPYDEKEEQFAKVTLSMSLDDNGELVVTMSDDEGKLEDYSISEKRQVIGGDEYVTTVANATFRLPVSSVEELSEQFLYPRVYFIDTHADYYVGNTHYVSASSLPIDITLNDVVDLELTQPQGLEVVDDTVAQTGFKLRWNSLTGESINSALYNYNKAMLEPLGLSIGEKSLKYNIYISQNKKDLDNLIKYDTDRENTPAEITDIIKVHDYEDKTPDNGLDLSSAVDSNGTALRTALRNGSIVKIENVLQMAEETSQILELKGLDKNQDYYIIAETVMLPFNETENAYKIESLDNSNYCKMVSATTLKDTESPSDSENDPAAPTNFEKEDVKVSSAKLLWDSVHEVADPNSSSKLEYQFVRLLGQRMDEELMKSKISYASVWEQLPANSQKVGWRTDEINTYPYDGNAFSETANDISRFTYDNSDYTTSTLIDNTLSPNRLYFYYIRTVRVVEGEDMAYSVWVPLTLTTTPVQGPYDLEAALNEEYDKEFELAISFKMSDVDMDKIGTDYYLQYAIKKDGEDWSEPINMDSSRLTYTIEADGTIICKYIIKNLDYGSLYQIKVRLYDNNLNDASLYSNVVSHRTNLNQDDYDNNHKINSWVDHYLDLINDIIVKPYWLVEDTNIVTTAIYRPGPFKGVLASTTEGVIDLADGIGGQKKTYYLPGSAIEEAYNANKGFRVKYNDMEVIFGPKSIDPTFNDSIIDIKDKIKTDEIKDYYVKITTDFNVVTYQINGDNPVSPVVNITVETVGSKKDINKWDTEMIAKLFDEALDEEDMEELKEDLDDLISDKEASEEFVKLVKDNISSYMKNFEKTLDKEFDKIARKNYVSLTLNSNIIITCPAPDGSNVKGNKQYVGAWISQDVSDYGSKKAIYTLLPGIYAFTGYTITIPGITDSPNGTVITNLVAKFGLEDYLGKGGAINPNAVLTRTEALGCAARISGAAKTDDPQNYLSSRGVSVVGRNSQANISSQETIYFTMMAYQIRTNTNIDSIQIRNYGLTSSINGIANSYKKAVQAAFETGIYTNSNMNPNGTITVREFLEMLAVLAKKTAIV